MAQNVDQQELNKFATLATRWWDPEGDLKTLHQVNPLRLGFMAKAGATVTGIDMNKPVIDAAKLHQHESGTQVEYLTISAEEMAAERPASFDVVTCLEMLEHVPDPASIIRAAATLLKPGGHIFFSTLNRNPKSYLFAIIGAEYLLKILPKNTHDYSKFIRPSELGAWIRQANMLPQDIKGISYHPFTKTFTLTNDVSVNYLLHAKNPENHS
jgi:2-polyprenyl-6-hydroxyphenyl methylase/3-demethylubiquinone-9 3-methyltransferase